MIEADFRFSVAIRTAPAPEGPWTADVSLYTPTLIDGGYVYTPAAHPYLDESGQTLVFAYSNNAIHIQVVKVTFLDPLVDVKKKKGDHKKHHIKTYRDS